MGKSRPIEERFWAKVAVVDDLFSCWNWTACIFKDIGYGCIGDGGRLRGAHRVSWELHFGPIPRGMFVCHTCDNRACVRPDHLFLGTNKENMADCAAKGRLATGDRNGTRTRPERTARGEGCGQARLTEGGVRDIRRALAAGLATERSLAAKYGVSHGTIHFVAARQTWKHIP